MKDKKTLYVVLCSIVISFSCLIAAPRGNAVANDRALPENEPRSPQEEYRDIENRDDESHDWEDDYEYDDEEDEDLEFELDFEIAEQSLFADSIVIETAVAKDEVKAAIVAATLLLDHSEESPSAIEALSQSLPSIESPAVKRAVRLKLLEAYLRNDDPKSAEIIAIELLRND